MTTTATVKQPPCLFSWDEPAECTTPRGWCHLDNHPDYPDAEDVISNCVGNYLTYGGSLSSRGPNGELVHACCYIFRLYPVSRRRDDIRLGYCWFHTVAEAKAFIEGNIRAYFGQPREG